MLLRSRGVITYRTRMHFGALCKSMYNLSTRPRLNGLGRRNVRFCVHRGAAAKMFHFSSFAVITCFSHIFFFFLFPFFPFSFSFFLFFFFPFFAAPLRVPPGANRPLCPPRYATGFTDFHVGWLLSGLLVKAH